MKRQYNDLEIAVIGLSCRFPKSKDKEEFWENLITGKEMLTHFTDDELRKLGVSEKLISNPDFVKSSGYLEGYDQFDAEFFGYSPSEAEIMDPQLRIFHECAYKALEDAGYTSEKYKGHIGLYAGASAHQSWEALNMIRGRSTWEGSQLIDKDYLSTRVSYKLNLKGPSYTVFTACSTSLVAINTACMSILTGQCDIALAGGVSINSDQIGHLFEEGMIGSKDGRNRTFDKDASGTVSANGAGVVVLKRLTDALEDGDNIYAIVKGFAVNNDGSRKAGFTAPSIDGQSDVISTAIEMAEIGSESVGYVECHGTATRIGDPIEIEALKKAFNTNRKNFCALGSVKSNTGHLDSAAGVCGFIKAVLCLKNKTLVPTLHYKEPNPMINFKDSPFYVNTETRSWVTKDHPLRAGVSSFGIGGTNAHTILEEAPEVTKNEDNGKKYKIVCVSGKTENACLRNYSNIVNFLKNNRDINTADAAFTLQTSRNHFKYRKAAVFHDSDDTVRECRAEGNSPAKTIAKSERRICFMFPGQGSQYLNMAQSLYFSEKVFRDEMDGNFQILSDIDGRDYKKMIFKTETTEDAVSKINNTDVTQPLLFIIEYSLAKMLMYWGIKPDAMIGHSIGEYVAATLSGVIEKKDALKMVVERGKIMAKAGEGAMMSIIIDKEKLSKLINDEIDIAAVNSTESCVVSGKVEAIDRFRKKLEDIGYTCSKLRVNRAFHSSLMEVSLGDFRDCASKFRYSEPKIKYMSNLTGQPAAKEDVTNPDYWVKHLRNTVNFSDGIENLLNQPTLFIEVGPGKSLTAFTENHKNYDNRSVCVPLIRKANEQIDDVEYLIGQIGRIWMNGADLDWNKFYENENRRKISVPVYDFDSQYFESRVDIEKIRSEYSDKAEDSVNDLSRSLYIQSWKKSILLDHPGFQDLKGSFLCLSDRSELCNKIISLLKSSGCEITEVYEPSGLKNIISSFMVPDKSRGFDGIIHFWCNGEITSSDTEIFKHELDLGYRTIINCLRDIGTSFRHGMMMVCITRGAFDVTGDENLCPVRRILGTLLTVVAQENPDIKTKLIDMGSEKKSIYTDSQAEMILRELKNFSSERIVAFRNLNRFTESYSRLQISEKNAKTGLIKNGGVYLITGGLGKIGLDLCEYLSKEYNAKIILVSRSVKDISYIGGKIKIFTADLSKKHEMEKVFKDSEDAFGKINGIFHLAGITDEKYFVAANKITEEVTEEHFKAKVYGLSVLKDIVEENKPDFCFVASSVSSILGGLGFGAYGCANMFMDGFIERELKTSDLPWILVNLDGWRSQRENNSSDDDGRFFISTADGLNLIEHILDLRARGLGSVVHSITDLEERLNLWVGMSEKDELEEKTETSGILFYPRPEQETEYSEPETGIEKRIAELWKDLFRYEKIGKNDNFFDIGGDSLKAMKMSSMIHKEFGVRVRVDVFFNNPTVAKISEFLSNDIEEISI